MRTKKTELEVDFIGGQGPLTATEEKALSDFFKNRKMPSKQIPLKKRHRISKRPKAESDREIPLFRKIIRFVKQITYYDFSV